MKILLGNVVRRHMAFWTKNNVLLLSNALLWFALALLLQHFAYLYIDHHVETTAVGDILLNNLPAVNLDFFIVQGALMSTLLVLALFIVRPNYVSFSLKALAMFIIVRSFFISLTHLGVNLHQITLNPNSIGFGIYDFLYNGKNDFFFSGHVGASFLLALISWREKFWRFVFLTISVIFAMSVILAHMHYSIDVFAAPFITYSIFSMCRSMFKGDWALTTR